ncbi:MAG: hypothetical protein WAV89_02455 [Ignavibacteriaceae bacterium]
MEWKMHPKRRLKAGDIVEVKQPHEIYLTLDDSGCVNGLPFMPEMIRYCGKRYKVLYRIEKTCRDTTDSMTVSEFINDDVVYLDNARCSGIDHDGCQRGCMIFWKEEWLTHIDDVKPDVTYKAEDELILRKKLLTYFDIAKYFCQSTALSNATIELNKVQRLKKIFADVKTGTYTIPRALKLIFLPVFRKLYKKIHNFQPAGKANSTPEETLNLKPGDLVEVKQLKEIITTLDKYGKNKGLEFSPDMKQFCGKQFKVRNRLDKMIIERSGRMRNVKNTVILEGVICNCFYAFGGCPRKEFQYWREIWLRRV